MDYLDLYLIHWPAPWNNIGLSNREARAETWRQMELLYEKGFYIVIFLLLLLFYLCYFIKTIIRRL